MPPTSCEIICSHAQGWNPCDWEWVKLGGYIIETGNYVWTIFLQVYNLWEWDQVEIAERAKEKMKIQRLKDGCPYLEEWGTVIPSLQSNNGVDFSVLPAIREKPSLNSSLTSNPYQQTSWCKWNSPARNVVQLGRTLRQPFSLDQLLQPPLKQHQQKLLHHFLSINRITADETQTNVTGNWKRWTEYWWK